MMFRTKTENSQKSMLHLAIMFLSVGVVFSIVLATQNLTKYEADNTLLFFSLILAVYSVIVLKNQYLKNGLASPLAIYAFLMLIHFAIPGFFISFNELSFNYQPNLAYVRSAQIFIIISFCFFHLGCIIVCRYFLFSKASPRNVVTKWKPARTIWVLGVLLVLGWIARYLIIDNGLYLQIHRTSQGALEGPFYAIIRLMEQMPLYGPLVAWIYLWTAGNSSARRNYWKWFILSAMVIEFVYWLPTGRKEEAILLILLPNFAHYLVTRRLPSKPIIVLIILFIILLFPMSYYYRYAMDIHQYSKLPLFESIRLSFAQGYDIRSSGDSVGIIILARLNLLEPVSACIRLIEQGVWKLSWGHHYVDVFVNLIPRILWPGKPDFHYGTFFGHESGILSYLDYSTSISVTFFGEAFLNFSWFGAAIMVAFGVIFSLVYVRATETINPNWILLYILTLPVILYIGGTVAMYFGGLIKILLFYYLIGRVMSSRKYINLYPAMVSD